MYLRLGWMTGWKTGPTRFSTPAARRTKVSITDEMAGSHLLLSWEEPRALLLNTGTMKGLLAVPAVRRGYYGSHARG